MEKVVKADLLQGVFPCEKVANPWLHLQMGKYSWSNDFEQTSWEPNQNEFVNLSLSLVFIKKCNWEAPFIFHIT